MPMSEAARLFRAADINCTNLFERPKLHHDYFVITALWCSISLAVYYYKKKVSSYHR
jgi:hypothetical protein